MHLRDAAVILANEPEEYLGVDTAGVLVNPSHDTEIHGDDIAVFGDFQVTLMHVGMKITVPERMTEKKLQYALGQCASVVARRVDGHQIVRRYSLSPTEGHDLPCREGPFDPWHLEPGIPLGARGEFGRRRGLHPEVEFTRHDALEMLDDVMGPQATRCR